MANCLKLRTKANTLLKVNPKKLFQNNRFIIHMEEEKTDQHTHLKLALSTQDSGLVVSEMAMEFKSGQMVLATRVIQIQI